MPPGKDTKVLVAWNGLMIAALAEGGRILQIERYLDAGEKAAAFIRDRLRRDDGRLLHTYKDGLAKLDAYLDDYANVIDGLTRLFEASGKARWLESALELARIMIDEFADAEQGGFFFTGKQHETLITRPKEIHDNATPSGNGMAATALIRLGTLAGRDDLMRTGRSALELVQPVLQAHPTAAGQSLIALDFLLGSTREIAVVSGNDRGEFGAVLEAIAARFQPSKVVAPVPLGEEAHLAGCLPLVANRPARGGKTTTYICAGSICEAPVLGVSGIEAALDRSKA